MVDKKHLFLFTPGQWQGQGKITFSASPDKMNFYTFWDLTTHSPFETKCLQKVEMSDSFEKVANHFLISNIQKEKFSITLNNELIGTVHGSGIITDKKIAWEFLGHPHFEGFEVYERQEGGDYLFHAEYLSSDHFRSIIDGRIWKKS